MPNSNIHNTATTWLGSVFGMRCARCRRGDMFPTGSFSFSKPFEMYETCPHCGSDLIPEPGFYFGAMFISYIISGFACLGIVAIFRYGLGWSIEASFGALLLIAGLGFVWFFRFSRSLWFHLNHSYDPNLANAEPRKDKAQIVRRT